MATAASLSIKLGLVTATFAQDSDKARAAISQLQRAAQNLGNQFNGLLGPIKQFGSLLGGIGLVSLIQQTVAMADSTVELAAGFSLSTAKVLQLKDALILAGGDSAKFEQILSKLYTAVDKAKQGDEVLIGKFQKLGISFRELATLTPEQAINRVTKALGDNATSFEKVALARELFGKSAAGIDFGRLGEELNKSTAQYAENAKNLENLKNVHDNVQRSLVNLQIAFAGFFPKFAEGTISVETFEKVLKGLFIYFTVAKTLALVAAVVELGLGFKAAATFAKGLELVLSSNKIGLILSAIALAVAGVSYLLDRYQEKVDKARKDAFVGPPVPVAGAAVAVLSDAEKKDALAKAEAALTERIAADAKFETTKKQIALEENRLRILTNIGVVSDLERKFIDIDLDSQKKINELKFKQADIEKTYKDKPVIKDKELATVQLLINAEEKRVQLAKDLYVAEQTAALARELQAKNAQGGFEAGRPLNESASARARAAIEFKRQQDILNKAGTPNDEIGYNENQQKIIDGIDAVAAADLRLLDIKEQRIRLTQILNDEESRGVENLSRDLQLLGQKSQAAFLLFKAVAISQAIIDTYRSAQGAYAALVGIPFIGPYIAPAAAAVAIAAGFARVAAIRSQQPAGRQFGGKIEPGKDYLVGESGVEAFRSDVPGTIVPNNQTEKMMNGGNNITIVNNPGATFDEKVLASIMNNMKLISASLVDENQRRFSPSYSSMGAG